MDLNEIRDLVSEGETEKAIAEMIAYCNDNNLSNFGRDAVLLSSKYNKLQRRIRLGLKYENYEEVEVDNAILNIISSIQITITRKTVGTIVRNNNISLPIKIGFAIDVSSRMLRLILDTNKPARFDSFLKLFITRVEAFAKKSSVSSIFEQVHTFLYIHGAVPLTQKTFSLLSEIGFKVNEESVPTESIRDVLNNDEGLSITPTLQEIRQNSKIYENLINNHLYDYGLGKSDLTGILRFVRNNQADNSKFRISVLVLIVSDDESISDECILLAEQLKDIGFILLVCVISNSHILEHKVLLDRPKLSWKESTIKLFELSSTIPNDDKALRTIAEKGKANSWKIDSKSKLFFHVTNEDMIKDVFDLILNPVYGE